MKTADRIIAEVSFGQLGLSTLRQLLAAGVTRDQVEYRVRARTLTAMHRGVYRICGVPVTYEQRVLAGCLATGGVASHRSAAALFRLRGFERERQRVEVAVAGPARHLRVPGVTVHTTGRLDRTRVGVVPATMPAPTLLALAGVEPGRAEGALADALVRRLVRVHPLAEWLREVASRGKPGTARLRALLEPYIRGMQPTESWLEDRLIDVLRAGGLPEPVRQYRFRVDGRSFRFDCAYPDVPLDVEADSRLWHTGPAAQRRDAARDEAVRTAGWAVERVTWYDLERDGAAVVGRIARHLGLHGHRAA